MTRQRATAEQFTRGQARPYGPSVSTYIVSFERDDDGEWVADTLNPQYHEKAALALLGYDNLYREGASEIDRHFTGTVTTKRLGPAQIEVVRSVPFND